MHRKKIRADQLLVNKGLVKSREVGKRLIMAGKVWVVRKGEKERVSKPGQLLPCDVLLHLEKTEEYVSRGAYKLLTVVERFSISFEGKVVLDVGASTGGFTHVALKRGAKRVYCVDVGYGQLHYTLRNHPQVINLERTNIRYVSRDLIGEEVDMILIDCSFISLTKVLPPALQFLRKGGELISLIKPQFELSPSQVKKGVVRSKELQEMAVKKVVDFCSSQFGLVLRGVVPSLVKGPKGNQEYLAYMVYL